MPEPKAWLAFGYWSRSFLLQRHILFGATPQSYQLIDGYGEENAAGPRHHALWSADAAQFLLLFVLWLVTETLKNLDVRMRNESHTSQTENRIVANDPINPHSTNSENLSGSQITERELPGILHAMFFRGACAAVFIGGAIVEYFSEFLTTSWWLGVGISLVGGIPLWIATRSN